jgi:hypothetical protein
MKTAKLILIASAILFTLPCSAKELTVCVDEMSDVVYAIDGGNFMGKKAKMDQSNMLAKYDAAVAKLGFYKFSDAVDKLDDISDKATALATAGKPKLQDSTAITDSVSAAIQCVGEY